MDCYVFVAVIVFELLYCPIYYFIVNVNTFVGSKRNTSSLNSLVYYYEVQSKRGRCGNFDTSQVRIYSSGVWSGVWQRMYIHIVYK